VADPSLHDLSSVLRRVLSVRHMADGWRREKVTVDVFEEHRGRLRAVAYRMLGSWSDADDAVQEAWLRLHRTDTTAVANIGGWLTTVVARVCLDMLRSRVARREEPLDFHLPDPVVTGPEQEVMAADTVGLALLVILDTLSPAERLAFVLHDLFAVPFDEIAPIVGRSPDAAKMLASRARRRVRGAAPAPGADLGRQRRVVDAFLAAARGGDFGALVAVLDPDVVARSDGGATRPSSITRGAAAVAGNAMLFSRTAASTARPVTVNGAPGVIAFVDGRPISLMAFTIVDDRIIAIDILVDGDRLGDLVP
jgi:RNA polymerase sigma factor (sigma-70 family)